MLRSFPTIYDIGKYLSVEYLLVEICAPTNKQTKISLQIKIPPIEKNNVIGSYRYVVIFLLGTLLAS